MLNRILGTSRIKTKKIDNRIFCPLQNFNIDSYLLPKDFTERLSLVVLGTFQKWEGHSDYRLLLIEIMADGF